MTLQRSLSFLLCLLLTLTPMACASTPESLSDSSTSALSPSDERKAQEYIDLREKAKVALSQDNLPLALDYLASAQKVQSSDPEQNLTNEIELDNIYALVYLTKNLYDKAPLYLEEAIQKNNASTSKLKELLADSFLQYSQYYSHKPSPDMRQADRYLQQAKKIINLLPKSYTDKVNLHILILMEEATNLEIQGNMGEAITIYQKILSEDKYKSYPYSYLLTLTKLGEDLVESKQPDKAIPVFAEAINYAEYNGLGNTYVSLRTHHGLACIYLDHKDWTNAGVHIKRNMEIANVLYSDRWQPPYDIVKSYYAEYIWKFEDQYEEAEKIYKDILDVSAHPERKTQPDRRKYIARYAEFLRDQGRTEEALALDERDH